MGELDGKKRGPIVDATYSRMKRSSRSNDHANVDERPAVMIVLVGGRADRFRVIVDSPSILGKCHDGRMETIRASGTNVVVVRSCRFDAVVGVVTLRGERR